MAAFYQSISRFQNQNILDFLIGYVSSNYYSYPQLFENGFQFGVYTNSFLFQSFQFFHKFANGSVSFSVSYLYVAAGAYVVIVFYNLIFVYQSGKLFFF